jgi:soluble cytochrome b562
VKVLLKNGYALAAVSLLLGSLLMNGKAIAHSQDNHGMQGASAADELQMKKLHAMMPMFSLASANLETALNKGESGAALSEAQKIITEIPDLKKSKPHKNVKQQGKFVELAVHLGTTVSETVNLAKKGDFAGAKAAFKRVEETCATCHTRFRD